MESALIFVGMGFQIKWIRKVVMMEIYKMMMDAVRFAEFK